MPSVPLAFPDFSCLTVMAISSNENSPVGMSSSVFETGCATKESVGVVSLFKSFSKCLRQPDIRSLGFSALTLAAVLLFRPDRLLTTFQISAGFRLSSALFMLFNCCSMYFL